MVGDPRPRSYDEDEVEAGDHQQSDREPQDTGARRRYNAADGGAADTEGDRRPSRQAVDEAADDRGGETGDLGDGQGDAELGDGDVETPGDDGEERPDVAVQSVRHTGAPL